jgi:cytochrome c oxidase subunit 3
VFIDASKHLDVLLGGINTVVLLSSSLFMALGVRAAQLQNKMGQLSWIALTILCAFGFLGIKTVEYSEKYKHHLVPGEHFRYYSVGAHGAEGGGQALESGEHSPSADGVPGPVPASGSKVPQGQAHIFFVLYFVMTGLHGIHVVIGILVLSTLWLMIKFDHPYMRYFMWVELAGLYWHFVDVVWIFLFPLYYLIPG